MLNSYVYWFNRNFSHWNLHVSWVKPPFFGTSQPGRCAAPRQHGTPAGDRHAEQREGGSAVGQALGVQVGRQMHLGWMAWMGWMGWMADGMVWLVWNSGWILWIYPNLCRMILPHAGVICRMSIWSCDSKIIANGRALTKSCATPKTKYVCTTQLSFSNCGSVHQDLNLPHPNKLCAKFVCIKLLQCQWNDGY